MQRTISELLDPSKQTALSVEQVMEVLSAYEPEATESDGGKPLVSRATVYRSIKDGTIPSFTLGRRILVPVVGLRRLLQLDVEEVVG